MTGNAWPAMRSAFADRFATWTRDEWAAHFAGAEACVTPVLSFAEAATDPHLKARGTYLLAGRNPFLISGSWATPLLKDSSVAADYQSRPRAIPKRS